MSFLFVLLIIPHYPLDKGLSSVYIVLGIRGRLGLATTLVVLSGQWSLECEYKHYNTGEGNRGTGPMRLDN